MKNYRLLADKPVKAILFLNHPVTNEASSAMRAGFGKQVYNKPMN
jgi:hypothetical protein